MSDAASWRAIAPLIAPDGVRVFMFRPEHWERAPEDGPGVMVARVSGTAGPEGRGISSFEFVRVPPDLAGDLSHSAEAVISPGWGDHRGVMGFNVDVLGLIEAEAEEAFSAVSDALNRAPA